jgi:hypothetical protein
LIQQLSFDELKAICESLKLSTKARSKKALIERISEYFSNTSWLKNYSKEFLLSKIKNIKKSVKRIKVSKKMVNLQYFFWLNNRVNINFNELPLFVNHRITKPYMFEKVILEKFINEFCDAEISAEFLYDELKNDIFDFLYLPIVFNDIQIDDFEPYNDLKYYCNSYELTSNDYFDLKTKLSLHSNYKFEIHKKRKMLTKIAIKMVCDGFGIWLGELGVLTPKSLGYIERKRHSEKIYPMDLEYEKVFGDNAIIEQYTLFNRWTNHNSNIRFLLKKSIEEFPDYYASIIKCEKHGLFVLRNISLISSIRKNICQICNKELGEGGSGFKFVGNAVFYVFKHGNNKDQPYNAGISGIENYNQRKLNHRKTDGEFTIIEEIIDHASKIGELERRLKIEILDNAGGYERYKRNPLNYARKKGWVNNDGKITFFKFLDVD